VQVLIEHDHSCYVEHNAGLGAGFSDQDYEQAGARVVYSPHEVFGRADIIFKVARPMQDELEWLRPGSILAGLLHLASARQDKVDTLLKNNITAVAYELIELQDGSHPVLRSMSQIGGRMAAQIAAMLLQNNAGGKGILLSGIASPPARSWSSAGLWAHMPRGFLGHGRPRCCLDSDLEALQRIHEQFPSVTTMMSNPRNINRACAYADVVVGSVLISGIRSPIVVTRETVRSMKPRAIIMDISIDQGGCVETSRPTTHEHPTFIQDGVIHYCVPNIPGVVARTATYALNNAALPYILNIANKGIESAIADDQDLSRYQYTQR
jgi:alanine dehydrogenase